MKRVVSLLITAILVIGLMGSSAFAADFYFPGDVIDDFSVELCDGSTFTLSEALATHKIVMLNIWASWCGPCRMEFPYMEEAYARYAEDVALACLSIEGMDSNDVIRDYMTENGLSILPMGQDTVGIGDKLVMEGYPTTIIIDQSGTYVYYECGSMTDISQFTRMFDAFLSEDHVPGEVLDAIPGPSYEGEYPDAALLAESGNAEGGTLVFENDEKAWPFVAEDGALVNSNVGVGVTVCALSAKGTARQGDVFKYDYETDTTVGTDVLTITANGEVIDIRSGNGAGTFAWEIPADGEWEFVFTYTKDAYPDENSDSLWLDDICIVSAEEGAAALAAQPVYPYALEGSEIAMEIVTPGVKEIVFDDPDGYVAMNIGSNRAYLVENDTAEICVKLGKDLDARTAVGYGDFD